MTQGLQHTATTHCRGGGSRFLVRERAKLKRGGWFPAIKVISIKHTPDKIDP